MKKLILTIIISVFVLGIAVQASDLVIESKTQSYNEQENKLKFDGNVKVSVDDSDLDDPKVQLLLESLELGLRDIEISYHEYIHVK